YTTLFRSLLLFGRLLDVDVVQRLAVDDCDAQFFCLRRVDQHAFHCGVPRALRSLSGSKLAATPWAYRLWIPRPGRTAGDLEFSSAATPRLAAGALLLLFSVAGPVSHTSVRHAGRVQRRRLTRRAMAGLAGEPLTWPPRGRWSRTAAGYRQGGGLSAQASQLPAKSNPYLARRVYQIKAANDPAGRPQSNAAPGS